MFGAAAACAPPSRKKQIAGKIYLCLDSLHANYTTVTNALTIESTTDCAHNSNLKIIIAADPGPRTGDLAAIAHDQIHTGVFKDEYRGQADFDNRGQSILGKGPYPSRTYYVMQETTQAVGTGNITVNGTFGADDGLTPGDGKLGVVGWNTLRATLSDPCQVYFPGEHSLHDGLIGARTVSALAQFKLSVPGTANVRTKYRQDYPAFMQNGKWIDGGVFVGALLMQNASHLWSNDVVELTATITTPLASTDLGRVITMDTDGDTGRIIGYSATKIWIATDGAAGNNFDNSPTSNDTFTITDGTGAGSQNGVGVAETKLYWRTGRPSQNTTTQPWARDVGSAFGNEVGPRGRQKFTITNKFGQSIQREVQTDLGYGAYLTYKDPTTEFADIVSTEDTYATPGARNTTGVEAYIVVHIAGAEDPTNRIWGNSFGCRPNFDNQNYLEYIGENFRIFDNVNDEDWPGTDFTMYNFSRIHCDRPFGMNMNGWAFQRTDWEILLGYITNASAGFYPTSGLNNGYTIERLKIHYLIGVSIAQGEWDDADGHLLGFQSTCKDLDLQWNYGRAVGGAINLYQSGNWRDISVPYTATTALENSDKGKVVTMTIDGDTGTLINYSSTHMLIRTDGDVNNSFDNSPTAGGAFTITSGVGAGSITGPGRYLDAMHQWGTCFINNNDLDNTAGTWTGVDAADNGIQLGGDNDDDAYKGYATDSPPTNEQSYDIEIVGNRCIGFTNGVRVKWRDPDPAKCRVHDNFCDTMINAGLKMLGLDGNSSKVKIVPYSATTALTVSDVGRRITMDTDGDTGIITGYDGSNITVSTDGDAANNFDNTPTANDTFTIENGTGAGSQTDAATTLVTRSAKAQFRRNEIESGCTNMTDIGVSEVAGNNDYVYDGDDQIFHALAASTVWDEDNWTNWLARTRDGSSYDPNSTRNDP